MKTNQCLLILSFSFISLSALAFDDGNAEVTEAKVAEVGACKECSGADAVNSAYFYSQIGNAAKATVESTTQPSKIPMDKTRKQLQEEQDPMGLNVEGPKHFQLPRGVKIQVGENSRLTLGRSRKEMIKYELKFK